MLDVRASASLQERLFREKAEHSDLFIFRNGKNPVVFQKHGAIRRQLAQQGFPLRKRICSALFPAHRAQAQDGIDQIRAGPVELTHRKFSALHGANEFFRIRGIGRHFQIHSRPDGCNDIVDGAPVGKDKPFEPPFLAEYIYKQIFVFACIHAVDLIIRRHHAHGRGFFNDCAEGRQIHFVHRTFVRDRIDAHAPRFLIVHGKMLYAAPDVLLRALHERRRHFAGKMRVLRIVFEVAPAQRRPFQIHRRAEDQIEPCVFKFAAQQFARATRRVHAERRRQRARGRDHVGVAPRHTYPVRAVGHFHGGQANFFDLQSAPAILARQDSGFLPQREFR